MTDGPVFSLHLRKDWQVVVHRTTGQRVLARQVSQALWLVQQESGGLVDIPAERFRMLYEETEAPR